VDLHFRNDNTQADHTQIPEQSTILNAVARGRFRSKIDLSDAYFQTRVHPDDVKYNTIKTAFSGFTSQAMMQGDINALGTFVRTREDLFHNELGKNIWVYIYNIFVFSDTFEEHVKDVMNACSKLQNAGYYANPKKSIFFTTELDILGHMIEDDGIHPAAEKIQTIIDWTTSATINPASEARAPRPDASDVVFSSSPSPASGHHSQRRLCPDLTSDLTHIPPPPLISCSSPPLISRPDVSFPASHLRSIRTPPQGTPFSFSFRVCS